MRQRGMVTATISNGITTVHDQPQGCLFLNNISTIVHLTKKKKKTLAPERYMESCERCTGKAQKSEVCPTEPWRKL